MPTKSSADELKVEAQQVLDELDTQRLLPFKQVASKVEWIGRDQYMVYFNDSRLPALMLHFVDGESFKDLFRAAILDRVSRMP